MNVFVLSTGRCGSETFARACSHMTNYTARHETHNQWLHPIAGLPYADLRFPDQHIEVDNRLSWFLGQLDRQYAGQAYYVHLLRDREEVARSLLKRGDETILYGFAHSILQYYGETRWLNEPQRYQIALQYWDTVNSNIEQFVRDNPHTITMWLHEAPAVFAPFWNEIGAEGKAESAAAEWRHRYNVSRADRAPGWCASPSDDQRAVARAIEEITDTVPAGATFALLDEETLGLSFAPAGRRRVAFPEHDGHYAGQPADDDAAVEALIALRKQQVPYFVIAWPAFWWLHHYTRFARCLYDSARCLLQSARIRIYALASDALSE